MTKIAAGAGDFISMCSVVEVGESRMKSTSFYNYQSFLPGKSCESIYNASKTKGVIIHLDTTGSLVQCIVE